MKNYTVFIMKTFKNPFRALVELRNVGDCVVSAKVSLSLRLDHQDCAYVSDRILKELLPVWVGSFRLYDGTCVLVSNDECRDVTNMCVPRVDRSFEPFSAVVELEDGLLHEVQFSFDQSLGSRRDFVILDRRCLELRGEVSIEVDGDEESEN